MGAKIFQTNQIIPQPDFKAVEGENGQWKGSQSFKVIKGDYDKVTVRNQLLRGKKATELDPNNDQFFDFLKLKTSSIGTETGGYTIINVDYQGYLEPDGTGGDDEKPFTTYSLRGTTKSLPINEHPLYSQFSDIERFMMGLLLSGEMSLSVDGQTLGYWQTITNTSPEEEQQNMVFVPLENPDEGGTPYEFQSTESQDIAKLISTGTTSYEVGTFEYSVRWASEVPLKDDDIKELGYIATPPGNPVIPEGSGRNWKLTTLSQEQTGTEEPVYQIELVYLLSDDGGWNPILYTKPE
jgi:hypothetical protein